MKIFHYLHESKIGVAETERRSPTDIWVQLPDGGRGLKVHELDKRALIVFDGDLLFGGLPKNAKVVLTEFRGPISCPEKSVRKGQPHASFEAIPAYDTRNGKTSVRLWRHFILLKSSTAIVRKYRNDSLSPVYVIIDVRQGKDGHIVEWRTSSY